MEMEKIPGECPVCSSDFLGKTAVKCPKCDAPHHEECWNYKDKTCSIFGCGGTTKPSVAPPAPQKIQSLMYDDYMIIASLVAVIGFSIYYGAYHCPRIAAPAEIQSFVPKSCKGDTIIVDYSLTLDQAISAGNYDYFEAGKLHECLDCFFPMTEKGKAEFAVEIVSFNRPISSSVAEIEMKKRGLRYGRFEELLAYGAEYPERQLHSSIFTLSCSWISYSFADYACLENISGISRQLSIYHMDARKGWPTGTNFLAVRER